jgi:hypothetical protein
MYSQKLNRAAAQSHFIPNFRYSVFAVCEADSSMYTVGLLKWPLPLDDVCDNVQDPERIPLLRGGGNTPATSARNGERFSAEIR